MSILCTMRLPAILLAMLAAMSQVYAQSTPTAQATPGGQGVPGVTITLTADKTSGLTVGDPLTLHLSVTHPAEVRVLPEQLPPQWGDFEVRSQSLATVNTNDDGTVTTSQDVDVALYAPGDFTTPPFTVTVITPDGKSADQAAPPVTLTVTSVLTQGDTTLRDIRPQADLQPPSPLPQIIAGLAGAALLMAVLALIYQRFFRRRRAQAAAAFDRISHQRVPLRAGKQCGIEN